MPFYNIKMHMGWVRNMFIRNTTTGEWMVNLILGYEAEEKRIALFEILLAKFPQITTLLYTIYGKRNDSMQDLVPQVYFGNGYITEYLEDFKFKISPKSFFQTNSKQAEKLYQVTRDFAELTGKEIVYDLYCGTGSIGIFCSKNAKKIIGVEVVEEAIEDAKENARMNQLTDTAFFAGDVIKICDTAFFEAHGKPDVIITDPPSQTALCSFSQRSEAYASIVGCQVFYRSAAQKVRLFALLAGKSAVKPRLAGQSQH